MERPDAFENGGSALGAETRHWLESLPAIAYVTDAAWWLGNLHFVADSIESLGQRSAAEYQRQPELWLTQVDEASRRPLLDALEQALARGEPQLKLSYTIGRADGSQCLIEDTLTIQRDAQGQVVTLVGLLRAAPDSPVEAAACRSLLSHCGDLVLELDEDLNCSCAAGNASSTLGMSVDQLYSRSLFSLMAPEDGARIQRLLADHAAESTSALLELRLRHLDGGYRWFEIHFSPYTPPSAPASIPGWVAVARDITERRHQSLQWDAYTATDELTSALNHDAFMGLLRHALTMGEGGTRLTLIVFDVDHFEDINQAWGRDGGDLVLTCIGEMCRATLRERFSFGRLGDDAFALLLSGKSLQETASVAERLRERFAATRVEFHGHWLAFSVSLGVAERRSDETAETFLARAEKGMRNAKRHGRNRVQQAP